ncbi:hypothetical protein [Actinoplanes cyaneus]|uniref:hypothetical protein n=1 Tax=Actinoplanes cyaneus TaxID=52696 RepID=UPI0019426AED|nr:hypothetical protein [Actinoplanes cyaneus]
MSAAAGNGTVPVSAAFVLLKPDCLRTGRAPSVEAAVTAEGLVVAYRRPVKLSGDDVRLLWSEYTDDRHVLMRAFLDRYLCDGPSEVWLVTGPDAFGAARRVKRVIRSRYANGPFANLVHTAERPGELARQGNHLFGDRFPAGSPAASAPRPAGRDFRRDVDVARLVDEVWPWMQLADPPAPAPHRLDDEAGTVLVIGADPAHSLDSAVTAVWSALPGVTVGHAVMLVLFASRAGGCPIAIGGRRAVERAHRTLLDHGFTACGVGPAPR